MLRARQIRFATSGSIITSQLLLPIVAFKIFHIVLANDCRRFRHKLSVFAYDDRNLRCQLALVSARNVCKAMATIRLCGR